MPEEAKVYKTIEKGENKQIRVEKGIFKNHSFCSIRTYYTDVAGNWQPGKGCPFSHDDIDDLIEGLTAMKEDT